MAGIMVDEEQGLNSRQRRKVSRGLQRLVAREKHKQLEQLHLVRHQGRDHDEECKQRARSTVQADFG